MRHYKTHTQTTQTALGNALNKASQKGHSVKGLIQEANNIRMAERYVKKATENDKLNTMARECIESDIARQAVIDIDVRDNPINILIKLNIETNKVNLCDMVNQFKEYIESNNNDVKGLTEHIKPQFKKSLATYHVHKQDAKGKKIRDVRLNNYLSLMPTDGIDKDLHSNIVRLIALCDSDLTPADYNHLQNGKNAYNDLLGLLCVNSIIRKTITINEPLISEHNRRTVTKQETVTIKNDIDVRDVKTYTLNPSHVGYESVKDIAKESMLTQISNFVATRETYLYNGTESLRLTCWKEFYLKYTHDINAYQQTYSLAKKVITVALEYIDNPLFDYTTRRVQKAVWFELIQYHKGDELKAIQMGWVITKILHKAVQQNGIEFSQHMKQWQRGL